MKKRIFAAWLALLPLTGMMAQEKDWANHQRYEKANSELTTAPKVVFMGNSITEVWPERSAGFWEQHPDFCGRGISGQTSAQILCRFQADVIDLKPKVVVILAGTNDVAQNLGYIPNKHIVANIKSMVELALAHKMKVAVCSVTPSAGFRWRKDVEPAPIIIELNAMIKQYVDELKNKNVKYVDYHSAMADETGGLPKNLSTDNCHPTPEGYKIMEEVLMNAIGKWVK